MQSFKCTADILVIMDATNSTQRYIDQFKSHALTMYEETIKALKEKARIVDEMRVKVVVFRDLFVDQEKAIEESPIFVLPQDAGKYKSFLEGVVAGGGGSLAESGLEAFAYAIQKMKWNSKGNKHRQIVLYYSDDAAHPFEKSLNGKDEYYPDNMPHNLDELYDLIESKQSRLIRTNNFDISSFRCFMFAPKEMYPYSEMDKWPGFTIINQERGTGLSNLQFDVVTSAIACSF